MFAYAYLLNFLYPFFFLRCTVYMYTKYYSFIYAHVCVHLCIFITVLGFKVLTDLYICVCVCMCILCYKFVVLI